VYCDYVLEHVEDPHRFFSELARVVKDGGHACFRTPNRWSYVAIVARLVPNRLHTRVTSWAQRKRKAQDVFPTAYRCNSRRALRRLLRSYGFVGVVFSMEGEPSYLEFSGLLYRAAALVQPFLPGFLRSTLHAFARRTTGSK
jgi:SAM-dependent methyltransferase